VRITGGQCHPSLRGDAIESAHVGEAEEIGEHRLSATVLVRAIWMQSVPATAGFGID
jgi:hypothetical protein